MPAGGRTAGPARRYVTLAYFIRRAHLRAQPLYAYRAAVHASAANVGPVAACPWRARARAGAARSVVVDTPRMAKSGTPRYCFSARGARTREQIGPEDGVAGRTGVGRRADDSGRSRSQERPTRTATPRYCPPVASLARPATAPSIVSPHTRTPSFVPADGWRSRAPTLRLRARRVGQRVEHGCGGRRLRLLSSARVAGRVVSFLARAHAGCAALDACVPVLWTAGCRAGLRGRRR